MRARALGKSLGRDTRLANMRSLGWYMVDDMSPQFNHLMEDRSTTTN